MAQYQVQDPQGQTHIIEGPDGATPDQVMAQARSLVPSQNSDFSPEKTVSNIIPDIKQMIQGAGATASNWAPFIGGDIPSVIPGLVKQGVQMLSNPKATAEAAVRPIAHPIDYMQEHPVQQALNVLGAGQLVARGAGSALNTVPLTENIVPTIEQTANNQTLKGFGGTMGQLKQMEESGGRRALDQAAQYARDKGLSDIFTTALGRKQQLENLLLKSGKTLGDLRNQAGQASPNIISDVLANPKANLDQYLGEGLASGELPQVDKALADIQRIGGKTPTHADLAKAATYINQQATGNKLYQPVTAATDLANALSDTNNQEIAQSLGSDKAQQYVDALSEQQKLHPLEHLQQRGELRSAGGRGGIGLQMVQKMADEFGYRTAAQALAAVHDSLAGRSTGLTTTALGANAMGATANQPSIIDLIQQLKQKYDQRRQM